MLDENLQHYYQLIYKTNDKYNNNKTNINKCNTEIYKDNNCNTDFIKYIHGLILKNKNLNINNNSDKNQLIQNYKPISNI
jgi:hypothetical protein